jgi:hypothetical protein
VADVEPFIAWLRGQGATDAQQAAFRRYAMELAKHPSLSAAIRAAEEAGTPQLQIANLRQTAARLVEFESAAGVTMDRTAEPSRARPLPTSPPSLDIEPIRPRTPSAAPKFDAPPRRGCECRRRHDVYLDNDFGVLARWLGGGLGIGTLIMIRLFGLFGALALALGLAGAGGTATIISICVRCEGCRRRVTDLDAEELEDLRKGRKLVVLVTVGLLAGAVVCGYLWWLVLQASRVRTY